jgi:acetoin utilization deacetylase AcuC-like enzyme
MKTAFFFDDVFKEHSNGRFHPERPERMDAIREALQRDGLWDALDHVAFEAADENDLEMCHTREHIEYIRDLAQRGGGSIDGDTGVAPMSYEVAARGVGAAMKAVGCVLSTHKTAFVAARPPGHHATPNRAMGFCLFNSAAIAARHAQRNYNLSRVAILDWDVHHGNGTQDIFYDDPSVFFLSVHQSPLYPGTGMADEIGAGMGQGTTLNFPLRRGSGLESYAPVWERGGQLIDEFAPELVIVSAGFDAHRDDPLGGMELVAGDFAQLLRTTKQWAENWCDGKIVCVLEGGYNYEALGDSVSAVTKELMRDD